MTDIDHDSQKPIAVTAAPHPFRVEQRHEIVEQGLTVAEILTRVQPDAVLRHHAYVEVGGVAVPQQWWPYLRPRSAVLIRTVPAGGGGDNKNVMRVVALIAVSIVSSGIASAGWAATSGGWFAAGSASAVALGAATALAGRALVNQIAPPARPDEPGQGANASGRLYGLRGTRNRLLRGEPVPRVMGRHRFTPPYAAEPFTEVVGDEQYLRALFCWGHGPVDVTDIRIGDTPIDDFDDVQVETVSDNTVEGHPDLFSRSVDERTLNIALTNSAGFQQRTTDDVADEITFDVLFPRGLFELDNNGNRLEREVIIKAEYAEAGTGAWKSGNVTFGSTQTVDIDVPTQRKRYRGTELSYTIVDQAQKFLIVVDAFDGTAASIPSSSIIGTDAGPITKPSEPAWAHEVAVVEADSANGITSVTDLANSSVTGFSTSQVDSNTVEVADGTVEERLLIVTEKRAEAFWRTMRIKTPDGSKTYDVRLRRETADNDTSDDIYDNVSWIKLRAIQRETPVTMEHVALTAIRIRASDQLNGTLDEVNGLCQAIMDEYDIQNDVWITDAAANTPAAAFRNVLEGRANERAVSQSRIDLASLETWAEFTAGLGIKFNHVFTDGTVTDALDVIASAGRASKTLVDGKWGVVVDDEKTTVVQHFTPRNSFDFQAEKVFGEKVHALRVAFINADADYQQDELVVYNDGFTADGTAPDETPPFPNDSGGYEVATRFEGISATGATSEAEAFKAGRYHLAVDALRPEVYTLRTDVEHLVATRGDLVRVTHDVPQWGTGYGRVASVSTDSSGDVDAVTLDTEVVLDALEDYVVRFRLADGTTKLVDVENVDVDSSTDTFTPATPISSGKPAAGDLAMVGLSGKESVEAVIKSIEPGTDLSAKLTLVDHAPAVQDAHDEAIPTFDPRITEASAFALNRPPVPVVEAVQSDEGVLVRTPDGGVAARLVVTITVPSSDDVPAERVQMRYRKSASASAWQHVEDSAASGQLSTQDVDQGDAYDVEVRTVSAAGVASQWTGAANNHVIVGTSSLPPDVTGFELEIVDQSVYLTWDEVDVFDLGHYEVRFSPVLTGATWGTAIPIRGDVSKSATETAVPGRVGTYLIKAVDRAGNKSANAAVIASNATQVLGLNVVELDEEDPDFDGTHDNTQAYSNVLRLGANNVIADWDPVSDVDRLDYGTTGPVSSGTYHFDAVVDLGQTYTSRLTPAVEADGVDLANTLDTWDALDEVRSLSSGAEDDWDVVVDVRTTDDDPSSSSVAWSGWQPVTLGDYTARAFDFRARLSADRSWLTPSVNRLEVEVDMPDRVDGQDDVVVSGGSLGVQYDPAFKVRPALGHTTEDLNAGEYVQVKNKSRTGFDVEIRDSNDQLVSGDRSFSWVAKGYGQEVTT